MPLRAVLLGGLLAGCGRPTPPAATANAPPPSAATPSNAPALPVRKKPRTAPHSPAFWTAGESASGETASTAGHGAERPPLPRREIDEAKVAAAGIRKLSGKHLTLYTDLPAGPEVDNLCEVFDLAYPQWCAYFRLPAEESTDWRLIGHLIQQKERFQAAGLYPDNLPPFANGYSRDDEFWLYEQPSDYYRRHLLLHEATHGFMYTRLRASAPPWYMEGIAEFLGTHRWSDGKLQLGYFPPNRDEVPHWGRIKLVRDDFKQERALFLSKVFDYPVEAHQRLDAYAWCWAAAAFLDGHPRYRKRFCQSVDLLGQPDFAERFRALYASDWADLAEEWQLFVASLDYGYDLERTAIEFEPGSPLPAAGGQATVAADRGWQSSGLTLAGGKTYRLKASGRYQVAQQPKPWWCEPGGVTIRYVEGQPLGQLQAAVRPDQREPESPSTLFRPRVVGLETTLTPQLTGTLYFKINDSPAELADNAGTLEVEVTEAAP